MISTGTSSSRRRISASSQPAARPTSTPPAAPSTNSTLASISEKLPPSAAAAANLYATRAVPSLMRLSPSSTDTTRRGASWRRAIAVAAIGSVGATIAPSVNAAAHDRPSIRTCATTATAHIVASTRPTASSEIGRRSRLSSCRFAKNAAEYSSGGRNSTSTSSGSRRTSGMPGTKPSTSPPTTSTIGYGMFAARAAADSTATDTSRLTRTSSTPCTLEPASTPPPLPRRRTARPPAARAPPACRRADRRSSLRPTRRGGR